MRGIVRRSLSFGGVIIIAMTLAFSIPISESMWAKILHVHGSANVGERATGTIGFWKNWHRHGTFSESEIETWLAEIDVNSAWLGPATVDDMATHFEAATGGSATMESRFLAHYLATRLNEQYGILGALDRHDISGQDPENYLGLADPLDATLTEIIDAIEANIGTDPLDAEYELMKDISDALNNLEI